MKIQPILWTLVLVIVLCVLYVSYELGVDKEKVDCLPRMEDCE